MKSVRTHSTSNRSYETPEQRKERLSRLIFLARSIMDELNRREAAGAKIDLSPAKSEWDEVRSLILGYCFN